MTQTVIDNAGSMSFNRDVTLASTTSNSRNTKYFRKGPFQSTLTVGMNIVRGEVWNEVRGELAKSLIGPYNITLPVEVIGPNRSDDISISGASQSGNTVDINSTASTMVLLAGDVLSLPGVSGTYMVTDNVTTDADGDATVNLDYPMESSPTDGGDVDVNDDITFSMLLVNIPQASQGPTGLVAFGGSFEYVEDL